MKRGAIVFALVLASAVTHRASAQDPKQLFTEGMDLEKKGSYGPALDRFRAAAQVKVTPGLLFHEGYCLEMTGKLAAALAAYESAEKLAREQDKAEVLAASRARSEPLAARVPTLVFQIEPKDAEIRVDGVVVGTPSTRIDPGDHEVAAQASDRRPKSMRVTVLEGGKTNVVMTLDPLPRASAPGTEREAAPPPATTTEPPPAQATTMRPGVLPWLATGGAVALLATGVVTFLVAGSVQSNAEKECPTKPSCDSERTKVRTLDTFALAGFIGGVGFGALAVVLWTSGGTRVTASASSISVSGAF